ncbi:bifunctional tRNA (5-methylaminomethyl-2-thiouridine)(34)-methyltransferase MnmD/FAD-dependent 5-carboxymethylaminomethyl-2-thiouridine(34) oxidoreductase MnmC [Thauera linaloolentis]|uniref:tRNA 5-methylaminomethyl-2-thiouridine biosynthesis bifunctional protein MnmC n=1 Tax=Thauera linaloolentis (strain DSM 12138 / JCM 21573 / CCUG 41526 / CIP 105981 / IAM 15112 / NBRC 102519 / 47Lol) TaxID=1123367 RepID=N6Y2R8_THAL4|nr:bifunctional tRNA (5-methylaminomethyl-2-thiouridine)(34)-methyltransferase MnmD/FAD-dependent 5-carboxymethylaminomethyl-2-thiouridine(34) oxidoreductase MnmC [Thauera linaloolentis]ENO85835.1 bifunctional tRNA (mnm(5)s(2)U34)-methyltransferase/FAD-dependent cmnm(5)s(2)U34 oxidoreductase [Thauera linaloolentis 47Lol = DSM 12138]MCM8567408.1 bifunctional tRNA (5-methylaminomethyl-2-thiouridine)(34)-methyltransferase MnmD/FAD-dependent 5-carboxymethylaminomethyl-2-thiouridine(34) oxidoreductase
MPIRPARLAFADDGTPWSDTFGDVYHSADGGFGQARHVFLAGNDLPRRWQGRERFVVLETGFGLGLNFFATWAAWRADPQRCGRLHFVSCELHPFSREDLATLHARLQADQPADPAAHPPTHFPDLAALSAELLSQWPVLAPGLHRLHLDGERVTLTLYFGDARDGLAQIVARADAFYLDGFSPATNPELWSAKVCHLLARLAAPGATLATWSVAGAVREHLRHAGFEVDKAPGFGGKRQMLRGRLRPDRGHSPSAGGPSPAITAATATLAAPPPARHALIIGAGLAGCALAERLAARGWDVELADAADAPATGASGNLAGVLRPLPSLDDNPMSRLTRAGTLYGWRHIDRLRRDGHAVRADACSVLHLARDDAQAAKMQSVAERLALPPGHLRYVDAAAAAGIAGWPVPIGGWCFGGSGWVQPPSLCAANLARHGARIRRHFGREAAELRYDGGAWHAIDARGETIARAPVMVLAAGTAVRRFVPPGLLPVVSARGQVSLLPAAAGSPPHVVVCRGGYVSPEVDGRRCAGATFSVDDEDENLRDADHAENLAKLDAMLPGIAAGLSPAELAGRVGFRPASPDRLPMIGALPAQAVVGRATPLPDIPRQPGAWVLSGYGARGLVWSAIAAELLASQLEGEPLPLERNLCDAVDPARFLLRAPRAGRPED